MHLDEPDKQAKILPKAFVSGILMRYLERGLDLGTHLHSHPESSELTDKSLCLWVIARLPFSSPVLAQLTSDKVGDPSVSTPYRVPWETWTVRIPEASICLSWLQPVSAIACNSKSEGTGPLTCGPSSPAVILICTYVQLYWGGRQTPWRGVLEDLWILLLVGNRRPPERGCCS